jgi:hypothetical protein
MASFLGVAGGRKKRARSYEPDAEEEEEVAAREKRMKHVPPCSFVLRLCSTLMLVPCFGLDPAFSLTNNVFNHMTKCCL